MRSMKLKELGKTSFIGDIGTATRSPVQTCNKPTGVVWRKVRSVISRNLVSEECRNAGHAGVEDR